MNTTLLGGVAAGWVFLSCAPALVLGQSPERGARGNALSARVLPLTLQTAPLDLSPAAELPSRPFEDARSARSSATPPPAPQSVVSGAATGLLYGVLAGTLVGFVGAAICDEGECPQTEYMILGSVAVGAGVGIVIGAALAAW